MKGKNLILTVILVICFGAGGFVSGRLTAPAKKSNGKGNGNGSQQQQVHSGKDELRETRAGGKYRYINPLWECDNFNPSRQNSLLVMKADIEAYVQKTLNDKTASHVSVYFRDLNSGPWMGVKETEKFSPASLLKVPILIAVLKKCEQNPGFLQQQIPYNQISQDNVNPNIVDPNLIQLGNTYTIEDLLFRMIAYSDNQAKELLIQSIGNEAYLGEVFSDIGINVHGVQANDDFVSVKDYSSFFRLLYNATYLNRDMSEKALEILSKTKYEKGIVAGLPKNLIVAHKFGERGFENSDMKQLHDCGIVYRAGGPYLICVMTRGNDFDKLASVIAGISEIVYKNVQAPV